MSDYIKQTWVDDETPADAEHFNHMEDGIEGAQSTADSVKDSIPTKTSELTNDSGFITDSAVESVKETADSALETAEAVADSAITGVTVNGTAQPVNDNVAELTIEAGGIAYAECNTNAGTDTKEVTVDGWEYTDGAVLAILFTKGNTVDGYTDIIVNGDNPHGVAGDFRCPENSVVFFVYSTEQGNYVVDAGLTRANSAITSITVNGEDVPVEDNKAEITVSGAEPTVEDETLIF